VPDVGTLLPYVPAVPLVPVMNLFASLATCLIAHGAIAADLSVYVENAPATGTLVFQVYDSPNSFGDFRDPAQEQRVESKGVGEYLIGTFIELSEDWRIIFNVSAEYFDDAVKNSPIVENDHILKGFAAITYVF
jgi:hypothetical protein